MNDTVYQKFVQRWEEIMDVPPQTLGPLTPYYKMIVKHLKVMPMPWLMLVSISLVIALYFLIGSTVTLLASILQRGF